MSFRRLVLIVSLLAVFAIGLRLSVDTDTFWHLAAGRWMAEQRQVLRQDVFSHTRPGVDWVNHSWLSQLFLFAVHRGSGLPALNLLTALLAVAGFALVWPVLEGGPLIRGFVTVLAASTAAVFWSARPQMFTFVAAACYLLILERWRRHQTSPLWGLPVIMLVWANLHGGFAVGFILLLTYIAGEWMSALLAALTGEGGLRRIWGVGWPRTRPLLLVVVSSLLAASVNPAGPRLLLTPFDTVSIGVLQDYIQEWQSPDFHQAQLLPFAAMLLLTAVALATSSEKKHPTELLLFTGLGYLSLSAARNISLFALALAPSLSRHGHSALGPIVNRLRSRKELPKGLLPWLNGTLVGLLLIAVGLWSAPRLTREFTDTRLAERLPTAAIDYIEEQHPPAPIFNSYDWGGYFIWRLWPEYKTYADGRTDLYGDEFLQEYLELWRAGPDWREILQEHGIASALLEPEAPLVTALRAAGWRAQYQDGQAVVLTRPAGE